MEAKLYKYDRLSMINKKFSTPFDVGHMVWQPYWIEGKILNNIYSGTAASIYAKLDNYNLADMQNIGLKFQPDRPRNLAARII